MTDIYTIDEIAHHNTVNDLWIVIHGTVYNLTEFQKEHPGGDEVLLQLGGQDATNCFESVGHSPEAINLREKFKIGVLMDGASSDKSKTTDTGLAICSSLRIAIPPAQIRNVRDLISFRIRMRLAKFNRAL